MKYQSQEKSFSFQNEQNMKKNINKFKKITNNQKNEFL